MSHRFHHTPGIIIKSRERGETARTYLLLTKKLGLISAVATGVRQEKSKLRPHLNSWQSGHFTLVRGREVWRLIGAEAYREAAPALAALPTLSRFGRLLPRLLPFAAPAPEVYDLVLAGATRIKALAAAREPELLGGAELLLVLKFLHQLGYLSDAALGSVAHDWEDQGLRAVLTRRGQMVALINEALAVSQL